MFYVMATSLKHKLGTGCGNKRRNEGGGRGKEGEEMRRGEEEGRKEKK